MDVELLKLATAEVRKSQENYYCSGEQGFSYKTDFITVKQICDSQ